MNNRILELYADRLEGAKLAGDGFVLLKELCGALIEVGAPCSGRVEIAITRLGAQFEAIFRLNEIGEKDLEAVSATLRDSDDNTVLS